MKTRLVLFTLLAICTLQSGCDNFDEIAEKFSDVNPNEQREALLGTWRADRVTFEFTDVTFGFEGFRLTFNDDNTWIAENGGILFSDGGSWEFVPGSTSRLEMGGTGTVDIFFTIDRTRGNTVTMVVVPNEEPIGGRTKGLSSEYVLELSKVN